MYMFFNHVNYEKKSYMYNFVLIDLGKICSCNFSPRLRLNNFFIMTYMCVCVLAGGHPDGAEEAVHPRGDGAGADGA